MKKRDIHNSSQQNPQASAPYDADPGMRRDER
jgi:hypothetical protein